jgi:hypothetical protein
MHSRAILVSLRISAWSARKYDRKVSEEVAKSHGTTIDAGRYNKHLMPEDAKTYKALMSHIAALRQENYKHTLAWSDDGWRLCPIKNWDAYTTAMRNGFNTAESLLNDFVADYPNLRDAAKIQRNGMFRDEDYPKNIRARFEWGMETNPVPRGDDYRVSLSDEEIALLAEKTERRITSAFTEAQNDAVKRLYECVQKIHERLATPDAIFRDSLIENARGLCDVLKRLNLSDDPNLEKMRQEAESLTLSSPDVLRTMPMVRVDTADKAQSILDSMTAIYGSAVLA